MDLRKRQPFQAVMLQSTDPKARHYPTIWRDVFEDGIGKEKNSSPKTLQLVFIRQVIGSSTSQGICLKKDTNTLAW